MIAANVCSVKENSGLAPKRKLFNKYYILEHHQGQTGLLFGSYKNEKNFCPQQLKGSLIPSIIITISQIIMSVFICRSFEFLLCYIKEINLRKIFVRAVKQCESSLHRPLVLNTIGDL